MYINWALYYIPKLFAGLAFIVNPTFVYLIFTEKVNKFGNYRFLLLYFASFNVVFSLATILVPIDIHSYRYCFFVFISDGWFIDSSILGINLLTARCSLISGSYAILLSHFVYRYLIIRNSFLATRFNLYMAGTFLLFIIYFAIWDVLAQNFAWANDEVKSYIRNEFVELYGRDSSDVNMLSMLYNEASDAVIFRSWVATISLTTISAFSILLFLILGYLTMKKLNENGIQISQKTSNLQKDLLKALTIQTVIPICVSFSPCLICWYSPIFNISFGRILDYLEVIALAAFAFCDPMAIVFCLPALRKRVLLATTRFMKIPVIYVENRGQTELRSTELNRL